MCSRRTPFRGCGVTRTGLGSRRPLTIAGMIAQELRSRILSGEIPAGARLQQNDVARQFGVSSTPVREAFAELRRDGLVTGSEHRGVRVFRPTLADALHASEVQEILEGRCIATSAPLLTEVDLNTARHRLDEHRNVAAGEWQRKLELDTAFHMALLIRCPNPKLRTLAETAHRDTVAYRLVLAPVDDTGEHVMETIYEQHEAIYAACIDHDGEMAAARTVDHICWARGYFHQLLG